MSIGVLVNPHARAVAHDPTLPPKLVEIVGARGRVELTRSVDAIEPLLRSFRAADCRVLGICGGDGTVSATLTAALRVWSEDEIPSVALLRGGTANTVAKNLGIFGTPKDVLARVLQPLEAGARIVSKRCLLRVEGRLGFLFGAAMPARFMDVYYGSDSPGLARAALLAARVVTSALIGGSFSRRLFSPVEVEIELDGDRVALPTVTLIIAGAVADFGLGFRVAWRAGSATDRFHFVATSMPASTLVACIPRVRRGEPLAGNAVVDRMATRVDLRFREPQAYVLDGDLYRSERVVIERGPIIPLVTFEHR